jgi:hypothetical protein
MLYRAYETAQVSGQGYEDRPDHTDQWAAARAEVSIMTEYEFEKYREGICRRCKMKIHIPLDLWSDNLDDHICFECFEEEPL